MSVVRGISATLGAQIIAMLLASDMVTAPGGGAGYPSPDAYQLTMGWIAALTIGAAAMGLLLRRKSR